MRITSGKLAIVAQATIGTDVDHSKIENGYGL